MRGEPCREKAGSSQLSQEDFLITFQNEIENRLLELGFEEAGRGPATEESWEDRVMLGTRLVFTRFRLHVAGAEIEAILYDYLCEFRENGDQFGNARTLGEFDNFIAAHF